MCGIVGFTGKTSCCEFLLKGLSSLEYRGYDSAGIAAVQADGFAVRKAVGRIDQLREEVEKNPIPGVCGIGHTRWATHGKPSLENCHPHFDTDRRIALVHNGIIENYAELKAQLMEKGVSFVSETDTEVVAQLLAVHYENNMKTTLLKVLGMLKGSFALVILDRCAPDTLYCARSHSPLVIGVGQGCHYVASDVCALLEYTRNVYLPEDGDIAVVTPESTVFYGLDGKERKRVNVTISWDTSAAQKNGFDHFMLKEICEQPQVIADTLAHYIDSADYTIRREHMPFTPEQAKQLKELTIAACGTAYHAGCMGKALIEQFAGVRTDACVASEYRYQTVVEQERNPEGHVFLAVSQSGETADTLAALRKAKQLGMRALAFSNVIGASIAREADTVMYTLAGPEIAVASTKAYLTQVLLFEILALDLAHLRGKISDEELKDALKTLMSLPRQIQSILNQRAIVEDFARANRACHDIFFIGRLMDYTTSLESALKLKEVSYLHSEAYPAGELKHGTIALIDERTLVAAIATQPQILEKTLSNMQEVKARGAYLLLIGTPPQTPIEGCTVWPIEDAPWYTAPLLATVYAQLFAYYTARQHGCDIDKPRNLAKSVTVE